MAVMPKSHTSVGMCICVLLVCGVCTTVKHTYSIYDYIYNVNINNACCYIHESHGP